MTDHPKQHEPQKPPMAGPGENISEPADSQGENYRPIGLASMRVDSVPFFDLYFRAGKGKTFVLYCEKHRQFTEQLMRRLLANNVTELYIKEDDLSGYRKYLRQHMPAVLGDPRIPSAEKASVLYASAQAMLEAVFEEPPTPESVEEGKEIVLHTIGFMTSEDFMLEHFLRTFATDYYLYAHSINVVAYSVALAIKAGHGDRATLREIGNGALMHDIGMSRVSPALRDKPEPLSEWEWQQIKQHPVSGYRMLHSAGGLGEIALDIVLHHHEKVNGRGYPDALKGDKISPYVKIVSIANIFDALTTDRQHRRGYSSFNALQLMKEDMRLELDQDMLRHFILLMGGAK
jgi:HD-GYP domain-containing protein (c-di-GMP phosphodiesterase class II)